MTGVEQLLGHQMLTAQGMIFTKMFVLVLMSRQSPQEFVEIANNSESGMVDFTIQVPKSLKDLLEKCKEKTLEDFMDINSLPDKAQEALNELSEVWLRSAFGLDFVIGLMKALAEQSEQSGEDIMDELMKYSQNSRSLAATLKELQG